MARIKNVVLSKKEPKGKKMYVPLGKFAHIAMPFYFYLKLFWSSEDRFSRSDGLRRMEQWKRAVKSN